MSISPRLRARVPSLAWVLVLSAVVIPVAAAGSPQAPSPAAPSPATESPAVEPQTPHPPASEASTSQPQAPLPWVGQETLKVELRTVPFYAVDAEGRPVYDLSPEEVRFTIGGRRVTPDTFDRYDTASDAPPVAAPTATGGGRPPGRSRHVFFLFDQAFTSGAGLSRSREIADALLDRLPASDQIYLVTNHTQSGFSQQLGPVAADAAGKAAMRDHIDALLPNVERLRARAERDLPSMHVGANTGRGGVPDEQVHNAYDALGGLGRIEYRAAAETLASGLEALASNLRGVAGAKLLVVFSGGVESRMYFDGDYAGEGLGGRWGAGSSSTGLYHVDSRRFPPIMYRFEGPLKDLAAAGAATIFVNPLGANTTGRNMVHHMGEVTGGLVVDNRNPAFVEDRIAGATSAYYEAGFYAGEGRELPEGGEVEVEVLRQGVTAWSPKRLQSRRAYGGLGQSEREYQVVDLVLRGLEGERPARGGGAPVDLLGGRVGGSREKGRRQLLFEGQAPPRVKSKELDLYSVVIRVHEGGDQPELVKLERRTLPPAKAPFRVATELPAKGAFIWGIVVVEPASGATYLRRLLLEAPGAESAAGRPSGR